MHREPLAEQPAGESLPTRIRVIDAARGIALLAMAIYHFTWDLEFFGYAEPGMTAVGGWRLFARAIAGSFIFLAGFSLFLAHGRHMRWPSFWRRFAKVGGAAALITLATYLALPDGFIFFGILHQIALASLLGLAFLRLPAPATVLIAAMVFAAPHFLRSPAFDAPALWWTGLSQIRPHSNDYVPLFPWFGAALLGIAAARLATERGWLAGMTALRMPDASRILELAGRRSLVIYLLHQPVLIAAVWAFAQIAPPPTETPQVMFRQACEAQCERQQSPEFCTFYCLCVLDRVEAEQLLDDAFARTQNEAFNERMSELAAICTGRTIGGMNAGGAQ